MCFNMASRYHSSYSVKLLQFTLSQMLIGVIVASTMNEGNIFSKKLFLERCMNADPGLRPDMTCEELWNTFERHFECPSTDCTPIEDESTYREFIEEIPPTTPANKTLFYSGGTAEAANNIGKNCIDKMTIQTTFLGQLFDDVMWCCVRDGDFDRQCATNESCTTTTFFTFWSQASEVFAGNASMHTAVVLNGSGSDPPYREKSIFTTSEVPSLTSNVISMTAILVYENDQDRKRWTCSSPDSRLPDLHVALQQKNIIYNCTDDYWFSSEQCNSAISLTTAVWIFVLCLLSQRVLLT